MILERLSRAAREQNWFAVAIEPSTKHPPIPWNKGKLVGAKPPLRPSHVRSIRTKLQIEGNKRDKGFCQWGAKPQIRELM